jgi:serine phosphatase RsbU (regulator of sigma subunit)
MEEKKISIFKSLAAKVFYYMVGLVIIVLAVTTYQNYFTFSKFLNEHASSAIVSKAEITISQVESQLEHWRSQVASAAKPIDTDRKKHEEMLLKLIDANNDFISIQILSGNKDGKNLEVLAESRTKKITDIRFEDKTGEAVVTQSIAEAKRLLPQKAKQLKGNKNTAIHSLAMKTKLPLMFVTTEHEVQGTSNVIWSILITWQTPLIKNLPKSNFLESALIDSKGHIFSSNNLLLMTTKNKFSTDKVTNATISGRKLSDSIEKYQSSNGKQVIGAYARSPAFGLAVLVEEDFDNAYADVNTTSVRTVMMLMLFILVAGMLAYICTRGLQKSIFEIRQMLRQIGKGNFDDSFEVNATDEITSLADDLGTMSTEISELMKADNERAMKAQELVTTKTMQGSFFPRKNILAKNLRISGFYQPSNKCGGDLWGHYELQDDVHLLYIADAMGVGLPAALVTAITYSVSATLASLSFEQNAQVNKPSEILRHINSVLWDTFQGSMGLTFFCAIIDTKNGKMTYANAGHNFPFLIPARADDPRGSLKNLSKKDNKPRPFSVKLRGNPLGMQKVGSFSDKELFIEPGDKIFLFSDGLIECSSPKGEVWGRKHLFNQLSEITALPFDEFKDEILSRAFGFFAKKPLEDDVTVVVAEIPKSWRSQRVPDKVSRRPEVPLPIPFALPTAAATPLQAEVSKQEQPKKVLEEGPFNLDYEQTPSMSHESNGLEFQPSIEISTDVQPETEDTKFSIGLEAEEYLTSDFLQNEQLIDSTNDYSPDLDYSQVLSPDKYTFEDTPSIDTALSASLDISVQEISTPSSPPNSTDAASEASAPTGKKSPKGKYKVRLPKTG